VVDVNPYAMLGSESRTVAATTLGARVAWHEAMVAAATEQAVDRTLADSFPASDPPSWTSGITRPDPIGYAVSVSPAAGATLEDDLTQAVTTDVVDVSRPDHRQEPFVRGLISLPGAVGIGVLTPFVKFLIGLPVALAVRGMVEAGRTARLIVR
jgi:hypothetical protein